MIICVADDPVVPHSCSCGEEAAASLINAGFGEVRFLPLARYINISYFALYTIFGLNILCLISLLGYI